MPFFISYLIFATSSKASKTVLKMILLTFILNLRLRLFIIYNYLQSITLGKIGQNDYNLDKYCNKW